MNNMTMPRELTATLEACIRFHGIGKPATLVAGAGHGHHRVWQGWHAGTAACLPSGAVVAG